MSENIKQILHDKSNDYSAIENGFFIQTGKTLQFDTCLFEKKRDNSKILSASVVIPAWNAEDTILSCISAIEHSSFNNKYPEKLQVIVTDDGSTDSTLNLLKNSDQKINLTVVHQENHGQGPAMNAGISAAEGDIIIEVDADTILNYFAIENLMRRHQFYKDALYTGFRFYVDDKDPRVSLNYIKKHGPDKDYYFANDERISFPVPGWPGNMCIASNHYKKLGNSNGLWMANDDNEDPWLLADMVFGMLFSLPREIFNKIGGFDDRFEGWGCDDGYVGAKAISEGVFVIPVYTATGLHISHPFRTEDKQSEYDFNRKFFFEFINSANYEGHPDWIKKASERVTDKFTRKNTINVTEKHSALTEKLPEMDADRLLDLGKFSQAYDLLVQEPKKDSSYYHKFSRALLGKKQYQRCIDELEAVITEGMQSVDLLFQLAMAYSSQGEVHKAKLLLERIAKLNPGYPELSYWLNNNVQARIRQGKRYFSQGFYDVAIKCFEAAIIGDESNREASEFRNKCLAAI